jgi:hypothetical protein
MPVHLRKNLKDAVRKAGYGDKVGDDWPAISQFLKEEGFEPVEIEGLKSPIHVLFRNTRRIKGTKSGKLPDSPQSYSSDEDEPQQEVSME